MPSGKSAWAARLDDAVLARRQRRTLLRSEPSEPDFPDPRKWLRQHGFSPSGWLYKASKIDREVGRDKPFPSSAAFEAAALGKVSVLRCLLEFDSNNDVRAPNSEGRTPMFVACQGGFLDTVQWLFDHGAARDIDTPDASGLRPSDVAQANGHLDVLRWLALRGCRK